MIDQFGRYIPDFYGNQYMQQHQPQKREVVRVNGKGGADAFAMAPNSDVLLLDTTAPIVWLKSTDGAGYATCTPYSITPYQPVQEVSTSDLVARIERLEGIVNAKPNNAKAKSKQTDDGE